MGACDQQIVVNTDDLGAATGNYIYQLRVENNNGIYRQCKTTTAAR